MKILKLILLIIIVLLLAVKIAFPIYLVLSFDKPGISILILLIAVLIIRHKISWFGGVILSICGIGYYIFFPALSAWPGAFVFTSSLNSLVFGGRTGGFVRTSIALFPLLFYIGFLILLISKRGKQYYFRN